MSRRHRPLLKPVAIGIRNDIAAGIGARPAALSVLTVLTVLSLSAPPSLAQTSPYYIGASQTLSRDTNLLRLPDDQPTPPNYSKSDTVSSTSLLAGVDQMISRQRVYGTLALRNNRYSDNPVFDNNSYNATIGLDWATVERISGTLVASAARSLQSFNTDAIVFSPRKNLETVQGISGSASIGVVTQYSLEVSGGTRRVRNSLDDLDLQSREFDQNNGRISLRWRPSGISSFGIGVGTTRGLYPRFSFTPSGEPVPDRFERNDVDFTVSVRPSGASTVDARVSQGRTSYDINTERDFSGVTGNINWGWQVTGKINLNTSYARETGQDSYAVTVSTAPTTADYSRLYSTFRVQADYAFSSKVTFVAGLAYADSELVQTTNNLTIPDDARGRNRSALLNLGARWTPYRYLQFGCDYSREDRQGSGDRRLAADLTSSVYGCFGQITLQ